MKKNNYPFRVTLMDDDFYALKWNTALIMRDPRTTVVDEAETPDELINNLKKQEKTDVILVDVEYGTEYPPIASLLSSIQKLVPEAVIVCTSQYGEIETIATALQAGVKGFLLKSEIRMAIVPAIMKAALEGIVVTPTIRSKLEEDSSFRYEETFVIPTWKPNPHLTPQIVKSFWLRVFFGMRASLAAEELYLETATVERYINQAYKILTDGWGDEKYLFDVDFTQLSPEDQAFVWFTLPPRK